MQRIELGKALMEEERKEEEEEMEKKPHLVNLPSFGAAPGDLLFSSAVDREVDGDDDDDDDDFEFAIAAGGPDLGPAITADELFSDGRILPCYPLFNLDLLPPAADPPPSSGEAAAARSGSISSSSSSEAEDLGFCAWAPRSAPQSPERRAKKSASTGSSSSSPARRWRIRDLVVGRSSSDGKDKFLFLSSPPNPNPNPNPSPNPNPNPNPNPKKKGTKVVKEMDMVTAHKLYYAKGGGGGGDRGRRSFLPYRQELFGFFGARTQHPF